MNRLTINEIIEHCERKTNIYEKSVGIDYLETTSMSASIKEYWEHKQVAEYLKELKKYKDAEEQELLLKLPCEVGDTVYYIVRSWKGYTIKETELKRIVITDDIKFECESYEGNTSLTLQKLHTTKEKAEQALKKLESEE